jgi:hypothetical protein
MGEECSIEFLQFVSGIVHWRLVEGWKSGS